MQYEIRALSVDNLVTRFVIEASDELDARQQAEARGLYATAIKPMRASFFALGTGTSPGPRSFTLLLFSQELLALLTAGISIVEALEALQEKESSHNTHGILSRLLTGLRDGKRFSSVLAEQPQFFPPLYVGIVQAAEGTSDLPRSLARFIDYQQRIDGVRNKIISAMIYPLILLFVGSGVTFFLIGYVVPRFAEVYQGSGRSLPWLSQLLLDWGRFSTLHVKSLLLGGGFTLLVFFTAMRRLFSKKGVMYWLAKLPGIGDRIRIYELSRLYLTLGMLLEGGIPVISALHTVQGIASANLGKSLQGAANSIQSGMPLSSAFEMNWLTTPISLRMLRVGERSGELGKMLTQSALFYDGEISRWTDRFTRSFEPLLMAAIGLVVGAIVVLLYMPIFDLAGSLS